MPKASWDDIVLLPAEAALLHQIADQVGNRSTVYQDWGFEQKTSRDSAAERHTLGTGAAAHPNIRTPVTVC